MRLALCWWPNLRWERWPTVIIGLAESPAIRGMRGKDRAVRRRDQLRLPPRAAWRSALARKRWARSRLHQRAAGAPDYVRRLDSCRAPEPWRSLGAWTSSDRFAAAWRIVRWC